MSLKHQDDDEYVDDDDMNNNLTHSMFTARVLEPNNIMYICSISLEKTWYYPALHGPKMERSWTKNNAYFAH